MARKRKADAPAAKEPARIDRAAIASVAPWEMAENWDHMIVNDDVVRTVVVSDWPNKLPLGWGDFFKTFDTPASCALVLRQRSGDVLRRQLARTINDNSWSATSIRESVVDRRRKEYESEQAESAIDMIVRSNARIYEAYMYVQLRAASLDLLGDLSQAVSEHMRQKMLDVTPHFANQQNMFWAASPFLIEDPVLCEWYNYSMPAMTVARGLFNRDSGLCDPRGIPFGFDDFKNRVTLDIVTKNQYRPTSNICIISESGQGKTTIMRMLIAYLRTLYDADIVINDVDGEYGFEARQLGGMVVRIDSDDGMLIDPFEPRNIGSTADAGSEGAGEVTDEEIREAHEQAMGTMVVSSHMPFLVSFLLKSFRLEGDEDYHSLMRIACERTYNACGITNDMTFRDYYRAKPGWPCLKDVYDELGEMQAEFPDATEQLKKMTRALLPGVSGADAHLWRPSGRRVPIENPVVCIDMSAISDDKVQASAQYYNVLTWEWSYMRSRRFSGRPLFVISDEVHKPCQDKGAAYMFKDATQRARKYGAGWIYSTQLVSDLMREDIRDAGEGIIANCTYRFYSKAEGKLDSNEPNNAQYVQALLNATDETMAELKNAPRGRFILQAGNKETWVNIEVDDWLKPLFGRGSGE